MDLIFILPILLTIAYAHMVYKHPSPASYKILYISPYAAVFVVVYGVYVYNGINDGGYDTSYSLLGSYIGIAALIYMGLSFFGIICNACAALYIYALEVIDRIKKH